MGAAPRIDGLEPANEPPGRTIAWFEAIAALDGCAREIALEGGTAFALGRADSGMRASASVGPRDGVAKRWLVPRLGPAGVWPTARELEAMPLTRGPATMCVCTCGAKT